MELLSRNIKYLRTAQNLSQQALAESLNLSRSNLAKYEKGIHDPGIEVLLRISRYFRISIDIILTVDLSKVDLDEVIDQKSMLLPMQVDANGEDIIEIIPHDASAGYLGSYSDPEYIEQLEHIYFPFLPNNQKCRAFPVNGDSMPPVIDGSFIIGSHIQSIKEIKVGSRYIIVSRDEGIVFKRISKIEKGIFFLQSDNPLYQTFTIQGQEILEVWEFLASISVQDSAERHLENVLVEKINHLQSELQSMSEKIQERE